MMRRKLLLLLTAAGVAGGGWTLAHRDQISAPADAVRLAGQQVQSLTDWNHSQRAAVGDDTIRIASFNIQLYGTGKSNDIEVIGVLAAIIRHFDVVALQEVRSPDPTFLARLVDTVNAGGHRFDFVSASPLGGHSHAPQYAFVFDTARIKLEGRAAYRVNDPDQILGRAPLVAWFRTAGVDPRRAFTFTLVNMQLDAQRSAADLERLGRIFRAVRSDGRNEDDVILLGDFNADDLRLAPLRANWGLNWTLSGTTTDTHRSRQVANIILDPRATIEFSGRSGVFDFVQVFNMTLEEANQVSQYLPVWAEFSVYEGGRAFSHVD